MSLHRGASSSLCLLITACSATTLAPLAASTMKAASLFSENRYGVVKFWTIPPVEVVFGDVANSMKHGYGTLVMNDGGVGVQ